MNAQAFTYVSIGNFLPLSSHLQHLARILYQHKCLLLLSSSPQLLQRLWGSEFSITLRQYHNCEEIKGDPLKKTLENPALEMVEASRNTAENCFPQPLLMSFTGSLIWGSCFSPILRFSSLLLARFRVKLECTYAHALQCVSRIHPRKVASLFVVAC